MIKNDAYMLLIDAGPNIMKGICYGENLEEEMEKDTKSLNVSYFRGLSTSDSRMAYMDIFTFTSDKNYVIPKNRVVGLSRLSSTHSLAFMDFIQKTTDFAEAKELPYFENHQLFEPRN